jgi:cysteinyl-tRNA synthetase
MVKFFNTLSGKIEPFIPIRKGEVGLYTCGPTVYDYAHIGNFRAYMFEDLLKRSLTHLGFKVRHIMNITDIDDKTIKRANEKGVSLAEFTQPFIDAFFRDLNTLNIQKADLYPRATEHIPAMVEMVKSLHDKGFAYEKDGSFYFNISHFPDYGKLSKFSLKDLKPGQNIESDEYAKESAVDFALWKQRKEGEPFWKTEIGEGRPGWHIECSAMSSLYLGDSFDIHCGGVDNIFPHHENEIAQSEAYTGKKFVNYWLHCHHLIVDGEKMAKSKGNFYLLKDILDMGYQARGIRFLLLSTHYRKQLNFNFSALKQAQASVKRLDDFIYEMKNIPFPEGENPEIKKILHNAQIAFQNGLGDDLNISVASTAVFDMVKKVNILLSKKEVLSEDANDIINQMKRFDSVLGILPEEKIEIEDTVLQKIEAREKARRERDFSLADRIRDELLAEGIVLEDTKDGVRWKRR